MTNPLETYDKLLNKVQAQQAQLEGLGLGTVPITATSGAIDATSAIIPVTPASPASGSPVSTAVQAERLIGGDVSEVIFSGKSTFTDPKQGWRQGIDPTDGNFKWVLGSGAATIDFGVSRLGVLSISISGSISNAIFIDDSSDSIYPAIDIRRSVGHGSGMLIVIEDPSGYGISIRQHSNTPAFHIVSDNANQFAIPVQYQHTQAISSNYWRIAEYRGGSSEETPDVAAFQWVGIANPNGVLDGSFGDILQSKEGKLYVNTDDSTGWQDLTSSASTYSATYTSGKPITDRSTVAIETDGLLYPTRHLDGLSNLDTEAAVISGNPKNIQRYGIDASDQVKVFFHIEDSTPDALRGFLVNVDPATGLITSSSLNSVSSPTVSMDQISCFDAKKLTTHKIVVVWSDWDDSVPDTKNIYAKIINVAGGAWTQGTAVLVHTYTQTGNVTISVNVSIESATSFFVWYRHFTAGSPVGIHARYCTVSSNTITLSTDNVVTNEAGDWPQGAGSWAGTSHHLICFDNDSGTTKYYKCGVSSGGTLTFGSAVNAGLYSNYNDSNHSVYGIHKFAELTPTMMAGFNSNNVTQYNVNERVVTRTGTSISIRASAGVLTNFDGVTPFDVHSLGNMEVMISGAKSTGATGTNVAFLRYSSNASPTVGTIYQADGTTSQAGGHSSPFTSSNVLVVGGTGTSNYNVYSVTCRTNQSGYVGILNGDVALSGNATVQFAGERSGFSSLNPSSPYYNYPAGGITLNRSYGGTKAGVATSSTKLLIST